MPDGPTAPPFHHPRLGIWLLAALAGVTWGFAFAAAPEPAELARAKAWSAQHLLAKTPALPFCFVCQGSPAPAFLKPENLRRAIHSLDAQRQEHTLTWTDAATGLQVRCVVVDSADFPAVEWTVYLKNTGSRDSPLLEDIQGLEAWFDSALPGNFTLHGIQGDTCAAESFRPYTLPLPPGASKRFSPPVNGDRVSGKSSDGPDGWPYFNLQMPGGGVIVAVGWPGQWEASFARDPVRGVKVKAGQQLTHLVLRPGEEIRTPLIALVFWQGDDLVRAQNLWRSWYVSQNLPRIAGQPQPPATQIQVDGSLASWPGVQAYLDAGIKPDICWRDAGGRNTWFPSAGGPHRDPAWLNTGTWEPDPARYPQGFKPFSDKARASGMQFLLWFEPERVGDPNSWLGRNHPEWLIPGNSVGQVLNLGNRNALAWLTDHVDGLVKSQGLDWYREDLNGANYGTAWRKHDAPDRQGMTENLHVQGHLAFWDELRRRNPGLHIDSCASGGRRNDLETMRRAVPLLRSDWSVSSFAKEPLQIEGNQGQTYGLSSWLPWQGAGVPYFLDRYAVRSYYLTGFGMIPGKPWSQFAADRAAVKRGYDEVRRIGPLLLGDYYPLTSYSLEKDQWIAWEFFRPDLGQGMVQAFRRTDAATDSLTVRLRGLDPERRYEIEDGDGDGREVRNGRELMDAFRITRPAKPAAALFLIHALPETGEGE